MPYLLAIDEGTTGVTVLVVNEKLEVIREANQDFEQHYPQPGWVEHDLNQIWKATEWCITKATEGLPTGQIAAIGITNQRETLCFWDKTTGEPISRAIVWQDRRSAEICVKLKKAGHEKSVQKKTGLLLDPYFSGTKLMWALKNRPEVAAAAKYGKLRVGTIDTFLLSKLTNQEVYATEPSNASRTLLFNIEKKAWDPSLTKLFKTPISILPEVKPSMGVFGKTKGLKGLPDGIPISGMLGDQQAALLGQTCLEVGDAKCTYGTGAFVLFNTGKKIARSKHRLLSTVAWATSNRDYTYALEGSAFIAGAAVQWFRDGLKAIRTSPEIEQLAASVPTSEGVVFVPALTGLGAPHWAPEARGSFTGLTRGTTTAHMARAVLEGIGFQISDILVAMEKDLGKKLKSLHVDGGASQNGLLMQFQADILNRILKRPKWTETTSLGAVFAAGLGAGVWKNMNEIRQTWQMEKEFTPRMGKPERTRLIAAWQQAVEKVI